MIKNIKRYLIDFIKHLVKESIEADILGRAASMSFYIITSFFPCLCIIFIAATHFSLNVQELFMYVIEFFPSDVSSTIGDVLRNMPIGKSFIAFLSVMSVWTMSGALLTASKSLNVFYEIKEERNFIVLRSLAAVYALLFLLLIISTMVLSVFGRTIAILLEDLLPATQVFNIWQYSRYIVLIVIVAFILACFYKYIPGKKLRFKNVAAGSIITTVLWLSASYVFAFYVNNFSRYHIFYGSIAGVIILISWIYLTSVVLLLGGAINATGEKMKKLQKNQKI